MTAITISRQLGSLGCQVGREAAARLGYSLVWREAINQAAIRAGAPEVALAVIDELDIFGLRPDRQAVDAYLQATAQVMVELAGAGKIVIVGRAGQVILRGREDVFHLRVIAPEAVRAARVAAGRAVSLEAALAQVKASDRNRRKYLREYYGVRWDDPELYDLVINTARLTSRSAADLVCCAFDERFSSMPVGDNPARIETDCD